MKLATTALPRDPAFAANRKAHLEALELVANAAAAAAAGAARGRWRAMSRAASCRRATASPV